MQEDSRRPARRRGRERFLRAHARASLRRAASTSTRQACRPLGINAPGRARSRGAGRAIPRASRATKASTPRRAILPPKRSSAACSPASPTRSRCGSIAARCAARWSTAAKACSRARASCTTRRCSSPAKCARSRCADDVETLLTLATAIKEEWLRELFPERLPGDELEVFFDTVAAPRDRARNGALSRSRPALRGDRQSAAWSKPPRCSPREVEAGACPLKKWDNAVEQWIVRAEPARRVVSRIRAAQARRRRSPDAPRADLPRRDELQGDQGARGLARREKRGSRPRSRSSSTITPPSGWSSPNGTRRFKITYAANAAPTIAARIQDLYGVNGELRIAGNRVPLVIQVLAPESAPDPDHAKPRELLEGSYPKIKQELSRKYPKHEWR